MYSPISIKPMLSNSFDNNEYAIKNFPTKKTTGPDGFTMNSIKH